MNKLEKVLTDIGQSDARYASAANALLSSVSSTAEPLAVSDSVKKVLGTNGLPNVAIYNVDQLLALADAMARIILNNDAAPDEDDAADEYENAKQRFRAVYEYMTDEQLSGMNDASFFQNMSPLERKAAVAVLIDISVDRKKRPADLWKQIMANIGGN